MATEWASVRVKVSVPLLTTVAAPSVPKASATTPGLEASTLPGTPPTRTGVPAAMVSVPSRVLVLVRMKPRFGLVIPPAGSSKVSPPEPEITPCTFNLRSVPAARLRILLLLPARTMSLVQVQLPSICERLPLDATSPRMMSPVPIAVAPLRMVWNSEPPFTVRLPEKLFHEFASAKPTPVPV